MKPMVSWIVARLKEPSTWAGVALFATSIQHALMGDPSGLVTVVGGSLAVLISESKSK
jgi:hypothetical protein